MRRLRAEVVDWFRIFFTATCRDCGYHRWAWQRCPCRNPRVTQSAVRTLRMPDGGVVCFDPNKEVRVMNDAPIEICPECGNPIPHADQLLALRNKMSAALDAERRRWYAALETRFGLTKNALEGFAPEVAVEHIAEVLIGSGNRAPSAERAPATPQERSAEMISQPKSEGRP